MDDQLAQLRAAGEPTRLRLLRLLRSAELTVTELTAITRQRQPGVSRHLRVLCEAGLVTRHQEGAWAFYRASAPGDLDAYLAEASGDAFASDEAGLAQVTRDRADVAARYFAAQAAQWEAVRALHLPTAAIEAEIARLCEEVAAGGRLGKVVDLGTGTGRMLVLLDGLYEEAVGYDTSPEMLSVARAELASAGVVRARVRRGDLFEVEDADAPDLVVLHHVLHFLGAPEAAVRRAVGLAAGGHVLIADFGPHDREELRERHEHRRLGFSDAEIARWAAASGARVMRTRTLPPPDEDGLTAKLWLLGPGARSRTPSPLTEEDRHVAA